MKNFNETNFEYKGYVIEICESEDLDFDLNQFEKFLCFDHRDFSVSVPNVLGFNTVDIARHIYKKRKGSPKKPKTFKGYWIFPLYAYIHGNVSLSLSNKVYPFTCQWDTSHCGFVCIKREKGTYTYDVALASAESFIETWNHVLIGNVYDWYIKDNNDNIIESCCGYIGDIENNHCIDDAKAQVDFLVSENQKLIDRMQYKIPFKD